MNVNTSKERSFYTQGKQFAARALFIVWLLASGSPEGGLATPKRQMVPATTTSPGDPSLASTPPTPMEGIEELPVHEDALEIVQNLIDAARDEQWSAPKAALKKLTQVVRATPPKMQTILPKLTKAAEDSNEDVRLIALRAFASLAPVASSAASTILPILTQAAHKDQDYDTRLVALEALAKITIAAPSEASNDSMEVLEAAAKDPEEDIREMALEALSAIPQIASSEATDTTTVPEYTADQQTLYLAKLLKLRAARKLVLPGRPGGGDVATDKAELQEQKDSEIQKLKSALERAQRNNEALLSENKQLRSAQGKKPEVISSSLPGDPVS